MDIRELEKLYEDGSKHSIYQNLPDFVSEHIDYKVEINEEWRGDRTRLEYVKKFISGVEFKTLGDIGANTGYFSLSLANEYKNKKVLAYEINRNHCDLMKVIKENFNMENIEVIEEGVDLSKIKDIDYRDIYIFFNVIHHAGVDFDKDLNITTENFMVYTENFLKLLKNKCKYLVFQMGYNHGGNKLTPIVSPEEVYEMLKYQIRLFENSGWNIVDIAYAENKNKKYISIKNKEDDVENEVYKKAIDKYLDQYSIYKNSEFYKRPIIILENAER